VPGGTQSYAYAINNLGQAVGASDSSARAQRAVLFERGVLRDLNALIPASAGWLLTEARDINDSAQRGSSTSSEYNLSSSCACKIEERKSIGCLITLPRGRSAPKKPASAVSATDRWRQIIASLTRSR